MSKQTEDDDPNYNYEADLVRQQRAKARVPTKQDIQNRIKDEMKGIRQGTGHVDMNPSGMHPEAPIIPSIDDLGLPTAVKRSFVSMAIEHAQLGTVARHATKTRDDLTTKLKTLWAEHVPDDVPSFYCEAVKLSIYTQQRPSFSKDVARDTLLALGVPSAKIAKAWDAATTTKPTVTLRITPPGEADE